MTQLKLPLDRRGLDSRAGRAWLIVSPQQDRNRLIEWLTAPPGPGSRAFFIDGDSGGGPVLDTDILIVLDRSTAASTLLLPIALASFNVRSLWDDVLRSGRPQGIGGPTAFMHELLLLRTWGGRLRTSPGSAQRSQLDDVLARLTSQAFRSNPTSVRRLCESELERHNVGSLLGGLLRRLLADAILGEAMTDGPDALRFRAMEELRKAAQEFAEIGMHSVAASVARMRRALAQADGYQYDLFDAPHRDRLRRPRLVPGLSLLRAAAIPLTFETSQSIELLSQGMLRQDVGFDAHLSQNQLRAWVEGSVRSNVVIHVDFEDGRADTEVRIAMVSEFERLLNRVYRKAGNVGEALGTWQLFPGCEDLAFDPSKRKVVSGEVARFRTRRLSKEMRRRMTLSILTPARRSANVAIGELQRL